MTFRKQSQMWSTILLKPRQCLWRIDIEFDGDDSWLRIADNGVLVIDDEADQASVDTRGTVQLEDDPPDPNHEPPSVIMEGQ
jgi:hypothetical protein